MRLLRIGLVVLAAVSGALLAARAWTGPYHFLTSVRSPVNLQSVFGLAVILALFCRPPAAGAVPVKVPEKWAAGERIAVGAILLVSLIALRSGLNCPFLSDDFYLVTLATGTHGYSAALWKHGGGVEFFRPAGGLALALTAWFAGNSVFLWHLVSLLLHLANSVLVYVLARRMHFGRTAALAGSLLFALHGAHPEAVTWVAGRFDLISGLFVLAGLWAWVAYTQTERPLLYAGALLAMILAILAKESAYAFPLLAMAALAVLPGSAGRNWKRTAPFWAVAAVLFAWRWWALGGVGGYADARTGRPEVLELSLLPIFKAAFLRIWSALFFPINWSVEPSHGLALLLGLSAAVWVWMAATISLERRRAWFCLAFVLLAALPALPQLLIGADLQKSRLLYLPSAGFCLLLGQALESLRPRAALVPAAAVLVVFQWASLHHNLRIWREVGTLADRACSEIAATLTPSTRTVVVSGLPGSVEGVYFLRNGLVPCLSLKTGRTLDLEVTSAVGSEPAAPLFAWDEASRSLKRK